ncbi:hypothetical protein [Streptomyces sp. NPDC015350]
MNTPSGTAPGASRAVPSALTDVSAPTGSDTGKTAAPRSSKEAP